jgi:hypothetical protein
MALLLPATAQRLLETLLAALVLGVLFLVQLENRWAVLRAKISRP